jgi:hypothetical protein
VPIVDEKLYTQKEEDSLYLTKFLLNNNIPFAVTHSHGTTKDGTIIKIKIFSINTLMQFNDEDDDGKDSHFSSAMRFLKDIVEFKKQYGHRVR